MSMIVRNPDLFLEELEQTIDQQLIAGDLSVTNLAVSFGCSRMSFYRDVKKTTGMSPNQYLTKMKLQKAIDLLIQTNLPIKDIAKQTGFSSAGYFSKIFKKEVGYSPTDYAKMIQTHQMLQNS